MFLSIPSARRFEDDERRKERAKEICSPPSKAKNKDDLPLPVAPETNESLPSGNSTLISLNSNSGSGSGTNSPSTSVETLVVGLAALGLEAISLYLKVPLTIPMLSKALEVDEEDSSSSAETQGATSGSSKNCSSR